MKRAITFSFDLNYKPWARGLIDSFKRYVTGFDLYPRYVTSSDTELTTISDIDLIVDKIELSSVRDKLKSFPNDFHLDLKSIGNYSRLLASDLMIYTNHSKFFTIVDLLNDGYDMIVSLNCDFLFVDNFDILINEITNNYNTKIGTIFANFELEHRDVQSVASIGESVTVTYDEHEQVLKPADDDFFIIYNNTQPVRDAFTKIATDLSKAKTGESQWNDDGGSLAKNINNVSGIELKITPLKEFQKCCLINLDHLYTTPIELFKKYPAVVDDIKIFYNRETQRMDIQVHQNYFDKLKDLNPYLYLPRFPRGHDPESGEKWDFFEEEIFIHIKKSAAFLYYCKLGGTLPGLTGITIGKTPEYNTSVGDEIHNWSEFLYEIKL